jgi:hypothetical protein
MTRIVLMFVAAFGLVSCSIGKDVPLAENEITKFHQLLNAEKFDQIVASAGPELSADPKLPKLLGVVHTKLGAMKKTKQVGWNDNANTSGHFVTLNYESNYEKGTAAENFVYRIIDGRASLVGYHINSDALIFN